MKAKTDAETVGQKNYCRRSHALGEYEIGKLPHIDGDKHGVQFLTNL